MCALTFIPEMKAAGWQTPWRIESWSRAALCAVFAMLVCRGISDLKCKTFEVSDDFTGIKVNFQLNSVLFVLHQLLSFQGTLEKKSNSIDVMEHYSKLNYSKYFSRLDHLCVNLNHILLKNPTMIHFQIFGRSKQIYYSRITLYLEFLQLFMARFTAFGF